MSKAIAATLFLICAAASSEIFLKLSVASLAGEYRRNPVENGYHTGVIQTKPLRWSNDAGRSWRLTTDLANGVLLTGPDNPDYNSESGRAFHIGLRRGLDGDYLPEVAGFQFNGELLSLRQVGPLERPMKCMDNDMIKSTRFPSLLTPFSRKDRTLGASILAFVLPIGLWAQNPAGLLVGNPDESQILVSPGQVTTLILTGVQTVLAADSSDIEASTLPLPLSLVGFSAVIRQQPGLYMASLPIFRVHQKLICQSQQRIPACMVTTLTVQIPPDILLNPVGGPSRLTIIDVSDNGLTFSSTPFVVVAATVHILNTCDSIHDGFGVSCNPFITHADGTLVGPFSGPSTTPAQPGETLVVYAVGLGTTTPVVPAGTPSPNPPAVATRRFSLILNYGCATKRVTPDFVGLTPGLVGIYQVNFVVPEPVECPLSTSGGNLTLLSDDWVSSSTVWLFSR